MGIPDSRELDAAFEQVTPLVSHGFRVLESAKTVIFVLACIQMFTIALLISILIALLALLITMNPDLTEERRRLVTPAMRVLARHASAFSWIIDLPVRLLFPAQASLGHRDRSRARAD
jgi:hypothetical protein